MAPTFTPLSPVVGAEVTGVDLTRPLDPTTAVTLHRALVDHLVLFFRDQHLTPAEHVAFARNFGPLRIAQRAAFGVAEDAPELSVLENDEARPPNVNHYHSDGIFRRQPEFASMLRAVECPPCGGDTIFVSLQAAYAALSPEMQRYLESKRAVNDFMKLHGSPAKARSWEGDNHARMDAMRRQNPPVEHPLVRAHPVTGRKSLYLSESFTTHIVGVDAEESRGVLEMLFRHCARPEFQCRFRWRAGSVALWDNRTSLHYAVADYWPARRLMHRCTIESDALGAADDVSAA